MFSPTWGNIFSTLTSSGKYFEPNWGLVGSTTCSESVVFVSVSVNLRESAGSQSLGPETVTPPPKRGFWIPELSENLPGVSTSRLCEGAAKMEVTSG